MVSDLMRNMKADELGGLSSFTWVPPVATNELPRVSEMVLLVRSLRRPVSYCSGDCERDLNVGPNTERLVGGGARGQIISEQLNPRTHRSPTAEMMLGRKLLTLLRELCC